MEGFYAYDIAEIDLLFSGALEEEEVVAKQRGMRLIEAHLYFQSGDSERTLEICKELEKEDPQKPFNYFMQASAYVKLNDYKNALINANKAESMCQVVDEMDQDLMSKIKLLKAYIEGLVKYEGNY